VYKKLSELAESDPKQIQDMFNDVDFELKALIDQARESRQLEYDGVYKSRDGKILAQNDEEMVYLLKQQPEFKKNLESLLKQVAKVDAITPDVIGRVNDEALALLEELDEAPILTRSSRNEDKFLEDEDEVFAPEFISQTIADSLKEGVIKVVATRGINAGLVTVPHIDQNIPKKTLQAFYENSQDQFKILLNELEVAVKERLEGEELERTLNGE
jgi:hypothetical protein